MDRFEYMVTAMGRYDSVAEFSDWLNALGADGWQIAPPIPGSQALVLVRRIDGPRALAPDTPRALAPEQPARGKRGRA